MYKKDINACTLLFKIVMSYFKKELDKNVNATRGTMTKEAFGLTFDGVRDNKESTENKTLSLKKRKRAIIIYKKCIVYKKPMYKKLKAYYYTFPKIVFKRGASLAYI